MRKPKPSQPISPEAQSDLGENKMDATQPTPLPPQRQTGRRKKRQPRRRNSLRAGLAVVAGRTAGALSRRLRLGGGTSIAGIVAQRVYPQIVEHLAMQLEYGSILVTGTNGKTTTSSFIAAILRDGGLRVWRNREGSNMMRGVATSLVIRAQSNGRLRRSGRAISILEVDEAVLPQLIQAVPPRVLIFTNLFRDQLDRYGEVNTIITYWQRAIGMLPASTILVLNADDPTVAHLGANFPGKILYYGIDDRSLDQPDQQQPTTERHQVMDTRTCAECGSVYEYTLHFYSHLGHYHCPQCGIERPQPDIRAVQVRLDGFDRYQMTFSHNGEERSILVPLPGLYNIYNALAAITAAHALNVDWQPITTGIEQSKPVFGRGERIQAEGKTMRLLLAKNPTGFNEVLRTIFSDSDETARHVLFILNDNSADGRDVSWIWDIDFERASGRMKSVVLTGTRALDLGLRLKYAGVAQNDMIIIPAAPLRTMRSEQASQSRARKRADKTHTEQPPALLNQRSYGIKNALDRALQQTPDGETLFIVPTYTGLLEVHHELEQRGLTSHYWEGKEA